LRRVEDALLAVDIGGTKQVAAIVTTTGEVLADDRVATDLDDPWRSLEPIVRKLVDGYDGALLVCGVGCGGPMSPGGDFVSPLNIPGWRDFPLKAALRELTGLDVFIDNDAKALALGEGWLGAARGVENFIAMVVSTGVGGGIVLNGRLLDGELGNAGHIGHVIVVPGGRVCGCGARGCLEAEASGTGIRAATGAPAAEASPEVVERTGTLVGRAVASVANLLDLKLAVVAGSVALGYGEPFFAAAQAELDRSCRISYATGARIVPAGLGPEGPIIGAAAVALRALGRLHA
jgi:glucokinase